MKHQWNEACLCKSFPEEAISIMQYGSSHVLIVYDYVMFLREASSSSVIQKIHLDPAEISSATSANNKHDEL